VRSLGEPYLSGRIDPNGGGYYHNSLFNQHIATVNCASQIARCMVNLPHYMQEFTSRQRANFKISLSGAIGKKRVFPFRQ
jgi:hypothetical protein